MICAPVHWSAPSIVINEQAFEPDLRSNPQTAHQPSLSTRLSWKNIKARLSAMSWKVASKTVNFLPEQGKGACSLDFVKPGWYYKRLSPNDLQREIEAKKRKRASTLKVA
jgi:hypothetical protein